MMGTKQNPVGCGYWDLLTGWKNVLCYMHRPRVKHNIKKELSRARRRTEKNELRKLVTDEYEEMFWLVVKKSFENT